MKTQKQNSQTRGNSLTNQNGHKRQLPASNIQDKKLINDNYYDDQLLEDFDMNSPTLRNSSRYTENIPQNAVQIQKDYQQMSPKYSPQRNQPLKNQVYTLTFQIQYETKFGEELAVVGSIAELGSWKEIKHKLVWGDGHKHQSVTPLITADSCFKYKYVLMENGVMKQWENGIDRIAELDFLPSSQQPIQNQEVKNIKHVKTDDIWEQYKIRFTVYDPLDQPDDEMWMKPDSELFEAVKMQRIKSLDQNWLISKYGKPVNIWECFMTLKNDQANGSDGHFVGTNFQFRYSYIKKKKNQNQEIAERLPHRVCFFDNPSSYEDFLAKEYEFKTPYWKIYDEINIVNGVVEKADGSFLTGFIFNEIFEDKKQFNIVVGSYPLFEIDVDKLVKNSQITAVLNLQTDYEIKQRGNEEKQLQLWYTQKGIKKYVRRPVSDNWQDVNATQMFEACKFLDECLNQNHKVYVHCTSGYSRCTTLVIFYLALYLKSKNWQQIKEIERLVAWIHNGSSPNLQNVQYALNKYKAFQQDLIDKLRQIELEKQRLLQLEEAERKRLDMIVKQQEQKLWQRREEYLKAERKRYEEERRRIEEEKRRIEEEKRRKLLEEQKRRNKEEAERQRLIKSSNDRENDINQELRLLDEQEDEDIRIAKSKIVVEERTVYEHVILGDIPNYAGLQEQEIQNCCDQLFKTPPIPFIARKEKIDIELKKMIEEQQISIPIVWIKGSLFLVGEKRIHLNIKADEVIANIGGGYEKLEIYINKNHKSSERALIMKMIQNRESLETNVEALMNDKKINSIHPSYDQTQNQGPDDQIQVVKRKINLISKGMSSPKSGFRKTQNLQSSPSRNLQSISPTRSFPSRLSLATSTVQSPGLKRLQTATSRGNKNEQNNDKIQNQIQLIHQHYQAKRKELLKELEENQAEKREHIDNQDQSKVELNNGKYAYIHNRQ